MSHTKQKKHDSYLESLTVDPHNNAVLSKRVIKMAWPVVLGMMTQSAINTIDAAMVGVLPEEYAIPGTAAVMSSLILLWGFGGALTAISAGNQALCARRYSEGNFLKTGQVLFNSVILAGVLSLLITMFSLSTLDTLVTWLTPSPTVQQFTYDFCQIRLLALFSMVAMAAYKSFYDGIGHVKVHMAVAILMNILNIIFNFIFIYGFDFGPFHVKAYYVNGAAIGSVLASYAGLLIMIIWTLRKHDRLKYQVYKLKNFDWHIAYKVFRLSAWAGLATLILMLGVGLFNYIVGMTDIQKNLPDINSSASSIIIQFMLMIFMFSLAVGIATATLVAQSIGAKKFELATKYSKQSIQLALVLVSAVSVYAFFNPETLLSLFLGNKLADSSNLKQQVIAAAIPSFKLAVTIVAPVSTIGLILTQSLYGAGENKFVMIAEFILHFCVFVPLAWLFAIYWDMGLVGCWYSACIYAILLLAATAYKFLSGSWKHIEL